MKWCGYNWEAKMEGGRIIHPDNPWYWCSTNTIEKIDDTQLDLYIKENPKKVKHWDGKIYHPIYECATLRSKEEFSFGTFSLEVKLPKGYNLWASFWLSGVENWPPEIDILEAESENNSYYDWTIPQFPYVYPSWRTTTNIHYNNERMVHEDVGSRNISIFKQVKNPTENFIKYEVEWLPDRITFKVNGNKVREFKDHVCEKVVKNLKHPEYDNMMNVIINLWVDNPDKCKVKQLTPMSIRNFRYRPYR